MKQLVFGHGINDADYPVTQRVNGKLVRDPFYATWQRMLQRCFSADYHERNPTYLQCTCDPDWLYCSVFREWMQTQNWKGNQLDKDILTPGNKHYCAEECVFVAPAVNTLLNDCGAARGDLPQGVYWDKQRRKYQARVNINGKLKHIGRYTDLEAAAEMYNFIKASLIAYTAKQEPDPRIRQGLYRHAALRHPAAQQFKEEAS